VGRVQLGLNLAVWPPPARGLPSAAMDVNHLVSVH
jgi:hypothetical protein